MIGTFIDAKEKNFYEVRKKKLKKIPWVGIGAYFSIEKELRVFIVLSKNIIIFYKKCR